MDTQSHNAFSERLRRAAPWLLVGAVALTFSGALAYPLLHGWDDNVYVTNNTTRLLFTPANVAYWFTHDCVSCYLPLTMISYMVDYAVWGLNAFGYHLQNLVWHAVAVVALYSFGQRVGLHRLTALAVAWLFSVHPQRVESVVWISERKDVLCAAFFFLALTAYAGARERGRRPWAAFVLFVCALLSKSMAITLPAVLFILECRRAWLGGGDSSLSLRRCPWLRILVRQWPFWALSLAFIPVALAFQSVPHGETTPVRQVLVAARNFLWYAGKTFVPVRLCPIYPKVEFTTLHIVGLTAAYAGGIVLAFLVWLRHRAVFLGLVFPFVLCYGVTLSPVSGLVPLGYVDMSDRYSYIPSAFLWLLAGFLFQLVAERFDWVPRLTRVAVVMVLAAGGAFMLESASYARLWQDIGTLTEAACRREPANVFALGQFGDIALDRGNLEDALLVGGRLAAAQRTWMTPEARQRALRRGLYLQGFALYGLGRPADALAAFEVIAPTLESTVYHQPTNNAAIWAMMADCYLRKGQVEQAIACYDSILERVREGSFEDHFYRGLRAVHKGDFAEGAAQFEQALVLRPDHAVARSNLAECRRRLDEDGNEGETDQ